MALEIMILQKNLEKTQKVSQLLEKLRIRPITMFQDPANMTIISVRLEIELYLIK